MKTEPSLTETPFTYRQLCWFCGEPNQYLFSFPHKNWLVLQCPHIPIVVPACKECYQFALLAKVDSIWSVHVHVKQCLIKYYRKDLAIGLRWTEEELASSEFEGGNFEGFQRSAWFMYEVAKTRVSFKPWPLTVKGLLLEYETDKEPFFFDGMRYPSIDDAILHYAKTFDLPLHFLKQVIAIVGENRFSNAIRFTRINVGLTPQEQNIALFNLSLTE